MLLEAFPQVHGRIGAPGAPALGCLFKRFGGLQARGFHQPQVARGKGVGPAQGAQRDNLRLGLRFPVAQTAAPLDWIRSAILETPSLVGSVYTSVSRLYHR